jgi:hypothetical protein
MVKSDKNFVNHDSNFVPPGTRWPHLGTDFNIVWGEGVNNKQKCSKWTHFLSPWLKKWQPPLSFADKRVTSGLPNLCSSPPPCLSHPLFPLFPCPSLAPSQLVTRPTELFDFCYSSFTACQNQANWSSLGWKIAILRFKWERNKDAAAGRVAVLKPKLELYFKNKITKKDRMILEKPIKRENTIGKR